MIHDFSQYPVNNNVFYGGAERKLEIFIDNERYIVKFQKNSEVGLIYNHVSEYLGSHIFNLLGVPAQLTFLGTYENDNVVVMKNFCGIDEKLVHFNDVGESTLEQDKELYQYSYQDIQQMLIDNTKSTNVQETIDRFWDMFIVDALNGNFDRHGGNWGFIKKDGKYTIAPVYDNGSCMYPKLNTDERIDNVLSSEEELNMRIFKFPTSHIKLNGRKSSYFEVISSLQFPECNNALLRITPKIDLQSINSLIDDIDNISEKRKQFYKTMYRKRYEEIILKSYSKIRR